GLSAPPRSRPGTDRGGPALRWANPRLWGFLAIYATGVLPMAFVLYAAPLFLGQRLGLSQTELGRMLWLPPLAGEVGLFFGAWVRDRLAARGGSLPALRRLFAVLALLSLPLAFTAWLGSPGLVLGALSFAMFISGGFSIAAMAHGTKVSPTARSGLV